MPGTRRQARILALQLLYQTEINPDGGEEARARFWSRAGASRKARAFATALYEGTLARREAIDALIAACLEHWKLSRLSVLVRNLLRMAVCEMIYLRESPRAVVIDEAVSLAREFVDEESARFANGVLQQCWERAAPQEQGPALDPPTAP